MRILLITTCLAAFASTGCRTKSRNDESTVEVVRKVDVTIEWHSVNDHGELWIVKKNVLINGELADVSLTQSLPCSNVRSIFCGTHLTLVYKDRDAQHKTPTVVILYDRNEDRKVDSISFNDNQYDTSDMTWKSATWFGEADQIFSRFYSELNVDDIWIHRPTGDTSANDPFKGSPVK